VLQQKVWVQTSAPLFPNIYAFLVGPPGIGKSKSISAIGRYLRELEGLHIAPTSVTGASLIDALDAAKVRIDVSTKFDERLDYNSMLAMPDELSALMHEYDRALVAVLTTVYDCLPYSQTRRHGDISIRIQHPQLSVLAGDTTSHLLKTLPEGVWDQGLMSRTLLIFSDDRPMQDDIFDQKEFYSEDLEHDLRSIFALQGKCRVTESYRDAYNAWRKAGCPPAPTHPRLAHYNSRRSAHLLKLSIIASADVGDELVLDRVHFDRALGWLLGAERYMPFTFQVSSSVDSRAIDEVVHWVKEKGTVSSGQLIMFMAQRMPINTIDRTITLMKDSRMLIVAGVGRFGVESFKVP